MEKQIHKKAEFVVSYLATQPARKQDKFWRDFIEDRMDELLLPKDRQKDFEPEEIYLKALSVFNVFPNNGMVVPIIGNWMIKACWMNAAQQLGLTAKGTGLPGRSLLEGVRFEPYAVFIYRGKQIIQKLDRLDLNSFKPRGSKTGIIKLREAIDPPAIFEFNLFYNDGISDNQVEQILSQMQWVGLGAFRQKFGKFQYV